MAVIDFSAINSFNKGPRESFEELVCVLARRENPKNGVDFQPNDGSGGDGGVEALWILSNGRKIGYQAKYFTSIGESQWTQMDESVKQALKVHPELQSYIFAISKDLTSPKGTKGKSQREKWDERVKKWKSWASIASIDLEFELWSETNLREMLLREENASLLKFWFGGDALNDAWFQNQVSGARRALDDRFNPQDHVEVSIESLFDTITRGPGVTKHLVDAFNSIEKAKIPTIKHDLINYTADDSELIIANDLYRELVDLKGTFTPDFTSKWNVDSTLSVLKRFEDAVHKLRLQYSSIDRSILQEGGGRELEDVLQRFSILFSAIYSLRKVLYDPSLTAEALQYAVIYGPAGAGKSHILGQVAEQRVNLGLPTILTLGQSFSSSVFWEQLGGICGLEGRTADGILGPLNAAGERKGKRTILLFDAINEGVGAFYWKHNLPVIIKEIQKYSNLSAVFSCRDEYLPYAIPGVIMEDAPTFLINGFTTPEELERAAIRYLDAKGIARPNTPWLSPEFSNPLFLKTVSESLHAQKLTEFPRGLHGVSNTMALYLDALSWRTGISTVNPSDISSSVKRCVTLIAKRMAVSGCDFIEIEEATDFADESFRGRAAPEGKTWLQVLIEINLFRRDPPPYSEHIDPFNPHPELVRFSFQRFQDYLMAKSLMSEVTVRQLNTIFDTGSPLNFLFYEGNVDHHLCYKYAGLISALSIIFPEQFRVEFAKTLPNWELHWEKDKLLQDGFYESFKWRGTDAFLDDTNKLFGLLSREDIEPLELLLVVSMTISHPYNFLYLHERLKKWKMPERDSNWTQWINWASREGLEQIERIVSWALSEYSSTADVKHLELASLVLAWSLTSSHQTYRDRATKALTSIFLSNSTVFIFLLEKLYDCDDPYVIERLYAAAFGACCIDQSTERLTNYSYKVYEKVFAKKQPPVALLTRDYALGIIEVASSKDLLGKDVNIKDCYHPLGSEAPIFGLVVEDVEKIAEERGGKDIFRSASNEWGDFGKYIIPSRVNSFLTTPIVSPKPVSKEKIKKLFFDEVIRPYDERLKALEIFENAVADDRRSSFLIQFASEVIKPKELSLKDAINDAINDARQQLECLLNVSERGRFSLEYLRENCSYEEYDRVDIQQCRLWVTKRAYELGWEAKLFPRDEYKVGNSRIYNDLERIGKKYQHIALDELQARLADNFWVIKESSAEPSTYTYSSYDFRRNLEPTILPSEKQHTRELSWIVEPVIKLPEIDEENLRQWPFEVDPTLSIIEKLTRTDERNKIWNVLYEFNCANEKYLDYDASGHGIRYEEFRFIYCIFLKRGYARELAEYLKEEEDLDVGSFKPIDFTDGPYLREAFWRNTWESEKFSECFTGADEYKYSIPIVNYCWESHLDKSLPNGFSNYMPQKWLAEELDISMSANDPCKWLNKHGEIVLQAQEAFEHQTAVVIDEDALATYIKDFDIEPVWVMIAERNSWPNGCNSEASWRRSESVIWREGDVWQNVAWNKDTKL